MYSGTFAIAVSSEFEDVEDCPVLSAAKIGIATTRRTTRERGLTKVMTEPH
jgi:hypothetical protein